MDAHAKDSPSNALSRTLWACALLACTGSNNAADGTAPAPDEPQNVGANVATPTAPNTAAVESHRPPAIPFQQNHGQWPDDVAFKADHFAGSLWVTRSGALVHSLLGPVVDSETRVNDGSEGAATASTPTRSPRVARGNGAPPIDESSVQRPTRGPGWNLVERFVGGHSNAVRGLAPNSTNVSYFIGADPEKWAPHVSTYDALSLGSVWPGIEVRLVARGHNIEKFFHVAPGAQPRSIQMTIDGVGQHDLRLSAAGALVVHTGNGDIELSAPVAYQENAEGTRAAVSVRYELVENGYRFVVGAYDSARELVIDPLLQSTYLGGSGDEYAQGSAAIDGSGNVVIVGYTTSTNYPGSTGGAQAASAGGTSDIVISKLNGTLTSLLQTTYLGGSGEDQAAGTARFDSSGNVIVAGSTTSTNYPGTAGSAQANNAGGEDIVVSRLNGALTSLVRSTYLGGTAADSINSVRGVLIESSGNILVAGSSYSTNYPGTSGSAQTTNGGNSDIVVSRLNGTLTSLVRSTYLGGTDIESPVGGLAADSSGNVYVVGSSFSAAYPGRSGGAQSTLAMAGGKDIVVSKLNGTLTTLLQSTYIGGTGDEYPCGPPAIDSSGNVLVVGVTSSTSFPATSGGAQSALAGGYDLVVVLLNGALTSFVRSTYLGGTSNELSGGAPTILSDGSILVTGTTGSSNYPGTAGGMQSAFSGSYDFVVSRLNSTLTTLTQSTYLGGTGLDYANAGVTIDGSGNGILVGTTGAGSPTFPGTSGGAQTTKAGGTDIVVTRFTTDLVGTPGCTSDANCTGSTPFCKTSTSTCVACIADSNCSDGNICSTDVCLADNTCGVSGLDLICCQTDATCDDGSSCTTDTCVGGSTEFVTNGGMTGGNLTTLPTNWTHISGGSGGVGTAGANLGYSLPASQNVGSASANGGQFAYIVQGATTTRGMQQTLTGLTVGRRYRVTGQYFMSPGTASPRALTVQVRNGATTYTLGRRTQ